MALNDAELLNCCLNYHKPYVDDIIVLDGGSRDKTVEVAKRHGARVVQRAFSGSFAKDKNHLMSLAETAWVLFVDCDEIMDWNFLNNMREYIKEESKVRLKGVVAFKFTRLNLDEPGTWPDYQIRLFRKDQCEWMGRVHEVVVDKRSGKPIDSSDLNPVRSQTLDAHPILHLPRPSARTRETQERWKRLLREET